MAQSDEIDMEQVVKGPDVQTGFDQCGPQNVLEHGPVLDSHALYGIERVQVLGYGDPDPVSAEDRDKLLYLVLHGLGLRPEA